MSDPRITTEAVVAAQNAQLVHRTMRAALEAALPHLAPQPVDREALIRAAAEAMYHDRWVGDPTEGQFAGERYDDAELQASVAVDAVLALLNGGQANG